MKFKEAKLDMKVISDGPLKIRGVITAIDDKEKSVQVQGARLGFNLWFFEDTRSEYDIKYLKEDPKARYVDSPPKFDINLADSKEFQDYFKSVIAKYAKELLPTETHIAHMYIHKNGKIVVKDNNGNKGVSKCHHDDAFNLEIGVKLAIQRLADKIPFVPKDGEVYYSILLSTSKAYKTTFYEYIFSNNLDRAIGNCFRTEEEAEKHKDEIIKRFNKLIPYAKTLNSYITKFGYRYSCASPKGG